MTMPGGARQDDQYVHASCVALGSAAVLIQGASGSGKSELALQLMSLGCGLISDDQTILWIVEDQVFARAPDTIRGMIEARGVGILSAETAETARVALVVNLDEVETERLPPRRTVKLLGQSIATLHRVESSHFPAAILQYLRGGRKA